MNALVLALAVRLCGGRIRPARVLLGAIAGAAIAAGAGGLSRIQALFAWLPAAMIMMRIARGRAAGFADALMLLCAAGLVGGMVLSLWGATGSLAAAYALGALAAVIIGLRAARGRQAARDAARARIICVYCGKRAVFDAMIDSGNTLRDYLTHLPVIVLPEKTGRQALDLANAPLRPIFAQTAGGRQQMAVFAPQQIMLELGGIRRSVQAAVALSPAMSETVPALVPAQLTGSHRNFNGGG